MNIYFIRHGESDLNAKQIHQGAYSKLTQLGLKQAEFVTKRLSNIPVDKIISSPFIRTQQTSEIIGKELDKPVEYSLFLTEFRNPSIMEGRSWEDPLLEPIKKQILDNYPNPNFRHSDEENFSDRMEHCLKALEFIESQNQENILVVSHGIFITMLIATMIWNDKMSSEVYSLHRKFFHMDYTGITWCKFDGTDWKLITWNDITHLN